MILKNGNIIFIKNIILIYPLLLKKRPYNFIINKNKYLISTLFFCYFILNYKLNNLSLNTKYKKDNKNEIFYLPKNKMYLKNEIINKFKFYIKNCVNGRLF